MSDTESFIISLQPRKHFLQSKNHFAGLLLKENLQNILISLREKKINYGSVPIQANESVEVGWILKK